MRECVRAHACVHMRARAYACACMHMHAHACVQCDSVHVCRHTQLVTTLFHYISFYIIYYTLYIKKKV